MGGDALFLLNGGHMAGGAGLIAFVGRNADLLARRERPPGADRSSGGALVVHEPHSCAPGRRQAGPRDRELDRSIIMPPDGFPPGSPAPPTDGAFFHPAGVPIVNLLAAPMYLFDAGDTVEMIHEESLVPVSRAAARLVAWTRGQTAAGMRAAVTR